MEKEQNAAIEKVQEEVMSAAPQPAMVKRMGECSECGYQAPIEEFEVSDMDVAEDVAEPTEPVMDAGTPQPAAMPPKRMTAEEAAKKAIM